MKFKNLILSLIVIVSLSSCVFVEEINVGKEGKGNYSFKVDMGEMLKAMEGMNKKDSLSKPEVLDSIIYFKDILLEQKDSIAKLPKEDQIALKTLGKFKLHMQVDETIGKMIMDFNTDFDNISELKDMQTKIAKAQALQEKKKGKNKEFPSNADITYTYKNKVFKRSVAPKNFTPEQQKQYDESLKQASMFLGGSLYKVIYHFDRDIKDVSFEGAKISDDRKTVIIEVPMDSLTKNPKLLDLEIKLD